MQMQALIFDCDGVLVDTERDGHRVAFNQAFAALGIDRNWSVERYAELLHTAGGKERMTRDFNEVGWPVPEVDRTALIQSLHLRKTDLFMDLIAAGSLPLRSGVARLVDQAIAAGLPIAVCSTSNERAVQTVIDVMLGAARARHITLFAGDIVAKKKPDPAIYTLAATTLNLDPAACVVIEDSHIGLTAARAAGMHCIVTKSAYTADEDFSGADRIVADLDAGIDLTLCKSLVSQEKTMPLTVIASLKAKPGQEAALFAELNALVAPTRAEAGCILYEMHRSHENPGWFIFNELWESRPLWDEHMAAPHLTAFSAKQDALVASWELFSGEKAT